MWDSGPGPLESRVWRFGFRLVGSRGRPTPGLEVQVRGVSPWEGRFTSVFWSSRSSVMQHCVLQPSLTSSSVVGGLGLQLA